MASIKIRTNLSVRAQYVHIYTSSSLTTCLAPIAVETKPEVKIENQYGCHIAISLSTEILSQKCMFPEIC